MPVRFACHRCRQPLAISARKVGSQITCPKCHAEQLVPTDATLIPATELPPQKPASPATNSANGAKPAGQPVTATPKPAPPKPAPQKPAPQKPAPQLTAAQRPAAPLARPANEPAKPKPPATTVPLPRMPPTPSEVARIANAGAYVSVRRSMLYAQGVLIAVVAAAAFSIGYFSRDGAQSTGTKLTTNQQPTTIEGEVVDGPAGTPDVGAVVIALPVESPPEPKLSIDGLRPQDPAPAEGTADPHAQRVVAAGGAYARSNATGQFAFELRPGRYRMLVISGAATRADSAAPMPADVETLNHHFDRAAELLTDRRYRLQEIDLPTGSMVAFSLD